MITIPYSLLPPILLKKLSRIFYWFGSNLEDKFPSMELHLGQAEIKTTPKEYLSMCFTATLAFFIIFSLITSLVLLKLSINILFGIFAVLFVSMFILTQQMINPKLRANRRIRNIERNLIPALQNLVVQLSSGVPLFNAISIVSDSDYGGVSEQFKIAIRRINAGRPQTAVLEEIARENPSLYFRRIIWQIINGMKTGSDISEIIQTGIDNLSEEQLIQIQRYGSQLNPLAMFYMIIAVIIPALGVTFVILLSSFLGLEKSAINLIFWGILGVVFFFQLMFLGILKTRRPNLLD